MDNELEQLGERIAEQAAHLDAATHRLLADLRVFDERGGWRAQGALSCAHWLSWRVGWGLGTARDHVRVARKIVEFPEIDDALRRGEVSYCKVRAMLRIATPANEHLLLEYARLMTGSQLEETCRKYALVLRHGQDPHPLGDLQRRYVRRRDTEDGMVKIEAVLHAEEAELVWTMLNHAAVQLTRNPEASPPNVSAETPHSDARNATADPGGLDPLEVGEIGESFVSGEAARRISCDCGVVEVIEDEHGAPLSVGRKRRTIAGTLKRALVKRDKTCTYPGCTNRLFLEGHHIKHWADGGETSLMNAALLCSTHHHYVHEYGYSMELGSDHRPQFRDPHGRLVAAVPRRSEIADLGWPRIRAANEPLRITADTIACEWDGTPVDYRAIIGHLVVADRLQ